MQGWRGEEGERVMEEEFAVWVEEMERFKNVEKVEGVEVEVEEKDGLVRVGG